MDLKINKTGAQKRIGRDNNKINKTWSFRNFYQNDSTARRGKENKILYDLFQRYRPRNVLACYAHCAQSFALFHNNLFS